MHPPPSFVFVFHRLLPKARVVYCSATGVTDVKNMVSNPQATLHILYFFGHIPVSLGARQNDVNAHIVLVGTHCSENGHVHKVLTSSSGFCQFIICMLFVEISCQAKFCLQIYPAILFTMLIGFLNHGSFMVHVLLPGTSKAFHCQFSCRAYALTYFCRAHKDM